MSVLTFKTILFEYWSYFFINRSDSDFKLQDDKLLTCHFCCILVLLFNVNGKHLRSCRDGQLT